MAQAGPILYALFVWWFSTGVIIYLDGLPQRTFRRSMVGASLISGLALWGLSASSGDTTVTGAYAAFTEALLAWGWLEISFYMGFVTGPRTRRCAEGCTGWAHFGHAIAASLYHELAILAMAAVIFALAWPGANHVGIWTFVVLWWMHQSAKLNVFLGVPNLNEQFVPDHLQFLRSFLNQKPMNLLFPVSVSISTVIAFLVLQQGFTAPAGGFEATGLIFLGTLMTLATLEHWFLVLPLPTQNLWQWSMASRQVRRPFDAEIVVGFLGAGKTSHVRRLLAAADPAVRTLVLVNDFGAIGIDGSLLSGRGAEIVELSNGCICCSLTADLATQLQAAIARWAPQRVVIEPSGVADVAALLRVLDQPSLRPLVRRLSVSTVIDAGSFLCDFARLNRHIQAQAAVAPLLIVNKVDLVGPDELAVVEATLRELNPTARIVRARHGLVEERVAGTELPAAISRVAETRPSPAGEPVGGWHAWSSLLGGVCGLQGLQALLDGVVEGAFGQVERVKGIARAGSGWVHFDIAGGRTSVAAFAPGDGEQPRVMAIGRSLDRAGLQAAFEACAGEAR